jgi:hypothetical protein
MEPKNKRPRTQDNDDDDSSSSGKKEQQQLHLFQELWSHFAAYLASTDQEDPEGTPDIDECQEMLDLASSYPYAIEPFARMSENGIDDESVIAYYIQAWRKDPASLVPVLLSVAAHVLADDAIARFLEEKNPGTLSPASMKDDQNASAPDASEVLKFLDKALTWFPNNPSTLSMLANWIRMTSTPITQEHGVNSVLLGQMYRYAARQATLVRHACLKILEDCSSDDHDANNDVDKEDIANETQDEISLQTIIEGLVLNQVVGVEYNGPEDGDDDGDADSQDSSTEWTTSVVEGTARFMAAMQFSMAGYHDEAAKQLKYFDFTHRLHPNVWNANNMTAEDTDKISSITIEPALYSGPVLPTHVLDQLRRAFNSDSPYWMESSYSQRGYYSFFIDRLQQGGKPKDFIQDVIESYLLPLVEKQLEPNDNPIVGYEWWVHTRPVAANLGHNLHFDTDEALLKSQQQVTHPIVSTVLYLDGTVGKAGPTIVLNQTSAEDAKSADKIWRNDPHPNSYLLFPGNMLHGVLPCSTCADTTAETQSRIADDTWVPNINDIMQKFGKSDESLPQGSSHRLTFMVGYWTRRVPDQMDDPTELYTPCGPMPPNSHLWIKELRKGYPQKLMGNNGISETKPCRVPHVAPAWEALPASTACASPNSLDVPTALDHRFFVRNPPTCFRESLFE